MHVKDNVHMADYLPDRTLTIDSMDVQPSDVVRDLGVLLDSDLTLKHHVNRIASTCF